MESSVRLFIEECDSFQVNLPLSCLPKTLQLNNFTKGLQLMSDTSTFGSFSTSFLMAFNDEFSRAPCLSFPLMGDAVPRNVNVENVNLFSSFLQQLTFIRYAQAVLTRKIVNDAVYLRELDSLSLLTVPILNPKTWSQDYWDVNLKISVRQIRKEPSALLAADRMILQDDHYHISSILSAHIESATLPLR